MIWLVIAWFSQEFHQLNHSSSSKHHHTFDSIRLPSITFPKVPFFSNSSFSISCSKEFMFSMSIVFIQKVFHLQNRFPSSPSINGELSLSTFLDSSPSSSIKMGKILDWALQFFCLDNIDCWALIHAFNWTELGKVFFSWKFQKISWMIFQSPDMFSPFEIYSDRWVCVCVHVSISKSK